MNAIPTPPTPSFYWRQYQSYTDGTLVEILQLLMVYKSDMAAGGVHLWGPRSRWRSGRVEGAELQQRIDAAKNLLLRSSERTKDLIDGIHPNSLIIKYVGVPELGRYSHMDPIDIVTIWGRMEKSWTEDQNIAAAGWKR